jgi:hypothetical protein
MFWLNLRLDSEDTYLSFFCLHLVPVYNISTNFAICCWGDHYRSFHVMTFVLASNYGTIYYCQITCSG